MRSLKDPGISSQANAPDVYHRDAAAVAANFDTYGKGNADLKLTASAPTSN